MATDGKILTEQAEQTSCTGVLHLDTGNIAAGIYLLRAGTEKGIFTGKMLVER